LDPASELHEPPGAEATAADPDLEASSGAGGRILGLLDSLMAATTLAALASLLMAAGRLMR
jgi:hypothetical protein